MDRRVALLGCFLGLAAGAPSAFADEPSEATTTARDRMPVRAAVDDERPPSDAVPEPPPYSIDAHGEYRLRGIGMSDLPLPTGASDVAPRLGQNGWAEQRLRVGGGIGLVEGEERTPYLTLRGELDLVFGVAAGDLAVGQAPAAFPRDAYGYPGVRARQLYLDWRTPIGVVRVGQMGFRWGMGLMANDGASDPEFGDARFGDLVRRVLVATRPFGESSALTIAAAFDWVAWDLIADAERPCPRGVTGSCGDTAFQGVLAAHLEEDGQILGAFATYRTQKNRLDDFLDVLVLDIHGRVHGRDPAGGDVALEAELAYTTGATSYTRTFEHPRLSVEQLLFAVELSRHDTLLDVALESGYASGDSNPNDGVERRAVMDADHRIGLILFPELLAAVSARSAYLAQDPAVFGRAARGSELLPTNGGVAGAFYLFPHARLRPADGTELRLGGVLAWSTTDVVDPYRVRAFSEVTNAYGGRPDARDLGVEIDASFRQRFELSRGVLLHAGVEGGVLIPGRAFDDGNARRLPPLGMVRGQFSLSFE